MALPADLGARMGRWGELAAEDMIQSTVAIYREQGLFTPAKLYTMTVEEVDSDEKIRFLMHIVRTGVAAQLRSQLLNACLVDDPSGKTAEGRERTYQVVSALRIPHALHNKYDSLQ